MGKNFTINVKNKTGEEKLLSFLDKNKIKFKSPKKPGMGQKKGKKFEKEISKNLSQWWSNSERDDIFYITSGSGSRFTSRKKLGKNTKNSSGDIGLLDPIGQTFLDTFTIEVKSGYNDQLDIMNIIDGKKDQKHTLLNWVLKAENEAFGSNKQAFIIVIKRDYKEKIVVVDSLIFRTKLFPKGFSGKEILILRDCHELSIVGYEDFFKQLKPENVKKNKYLVEINE